MPLWRAPISTPLAPATRCPRSWSRGAVPNDKNLPTGRAGREALGRSRGGLTTKIHLAVYRRCRPVAQILSPGQHGDCPRHWGELTPRPSFGRGAARHPYTQAWAMLRAVA